MRMRDRLEFAKRVAPLLTDASVRAVFDAIAEHDYVDPTLLHASVDFEPTIIRRAVDILKSCGLVEEQRSGTVCVYNLSMDGLHINRERSALPTPPITNDLNRLSL